MLLGSGDSDTRLGMTMVVDYLSRRGGCKTILPYGVSSSSTDGDTSMAEGSALGDSVGDLSLTSGSGRVASHAVPITGEV